MNVIFHTLAAVVLVAILVAWARVRAERDLLRLLGHELAKSGQPKRLLVEEPGRFLRRFAHAWGIAYEEQSPLRAGPQRLEPIPLFELFLHRGLILIRCLESSVELHVERAADPMDAETTRIAAALGGILVKIIPYGTAADTTTGGS